MVSEAELLSVAEESGRYPCLGYYVFFGLSLHILNTINTSRFVSMASSFFLLLENESLEVDKAMFL